MGEVCLKSKTKSEMISKCQLIKNNFTRVEMSSLCRQIKAESLIYQQPYISTA